jgi:hypothetical protein
MAVEGVGDVLGRLEALNKRILNATKANMKSVSKALLEDAKTRVPIDTGELIRSGYTRQVGHTSFVGFTAPHAAKVHERLDIKHPRGQAKFLEQPLRDEVPYFADDLAKGIDL